MWDATNTGRHLKNFFFVADQPHEPRSIRSGESAYVCEKKKKKRNERTKRIKRHDTRNKASGCSRFGSNFRHYATKLGATRKRLLAAPRHGIGGPGSAIHACVRAHAHACLRIDTLFTISPQLTEAGDQGRARETDFASQLAIRWWPSRTWAIACVCACAYASLRAIRASLFAVNTSAQV